MTRHNTTPTDEYETLLEAHTYELSHHRGNTRICRCGHVPTVDPSSGTTQQEYHRSHVASVLAARGNNTAHETLRDVLLEHGHSGTISSREGWVGCLCGENLTLPGGFDSSGYALDLDEEDRVRADHVADALRAALSPAPTNDQHNNGLADQVRTLIEPQWRTNLGYHYDTTTEAFAAGRNQIVDELRAVVDGPTTPTQET